MAPHPFLEGLEPTLLIAHRGGAGLAPENTLVAFEAAVTRYRAEILELDVRVTRDGVPVVIHDPTVDRCTDGTGAVRELTLAALRRLDAGWAFTSDGGRTHPHRGRGVRVPTLREVLEAFPGLRLNVDLKAAEPGAVEAFAGAVAGEEDRLCIGSDDDGRAARLAARLPDACRFFPAAAARRFVLAAWLGLDPRPDPRWHVLDLPVRAAGLRVVGPRVLRAAGRAGRWVNAWTVDDAREMRRLLGDGVGGIMTDRPDRLRAVLDDAAP